MSKEQSILMIYDISTYERRPATQKDIDDMESCLFQFGMQPERDNEPSKEILDFKLACFINRFRDNSAFVAEDKEIEPYKGLTNIDGSLCYPSTPRTRYSVPMGMDIEFAREIVKRWNAYGK